MNNSKKPLPFLIVVVVIIAVITTIAMQNQSKSNQTDPNLNPANSDYDESDISAVAGYWQFENDTRCAYFENDVYFDYQDCDVRDSNFVTGKMEVRRGDSALSKLGLSQAEAAQKLGLDNTIDESNTYGFWMLPSGFDESEPKTELLFVLTDSEHAYMYDYSMNEAYHLTSVTPSN